MACAAMQPVPTSPPELPMPEEPRPLEMRARWEIRRALAAALLITGVGSAALVGRMAGSRSNPRPMKGNVPEEEQKQEWIGWGVCNHIEKDVAYLYAKKPENRLQYIPTAERCCQYCQSMKVCMSWTWIQVNGDCYLEDVMPVRNISKKGYWAGHGRAAASPGVPTTTRTPTANPGLAPLQTQTVAPISLPPPVAAVPSYAPVPSVAPLPTVAPLPSLAPVPVPVPVPAPMTLAPAPAVVVTAAPAPLPTLPPAPAPLLPPNVGKAISGGAASRATFAGFLEIWRGSYKANDGSVPELPDSALPKAFSGLPAKIVVSSGGAAGGVVTEGMGYGIMVEAFKAAAGDREGLANGLALLRGWQGMVYGPKGTHHPFGGGTEKGGSTQVDTAPYGVSAIPGAAQGAAASGVAGWKFPVDQCFPACQGSATDGDEDAVLGMVYLAAALQYPDDFVDMVMRAVIAFASADLGFPDLYRTLPDGKKVFVPKGGSQWGGLLPEEGKFKSSQEAWCYNPSYFAPGHYRTFRDFVRKHWRPAFDAYLPKHLSGASSTSRELMESFDGAVLGGYNVMYYSTCKSGSVGNWVGVKSECPDRDGLHCEGVPWATTPYIGTSGECTASGTTFGSYGPDASRTPWRIAMDYILHTKESVDVTLYTRKGEVDTSDSFNAQVYLNRMANQYKNNAQCDGAKGDCASVGASGTATFKLSAAFDQGPDVTCHNVPNAAQSWWAAFMAWPTFTSFVAPLDSLSRQDSAAWIDTFANNCQFSAGKPTGNICAATYFELGQEVISSMVMAGAVVPLPESSQEELAYK